MISNSVNSMIEIGQVLYKASSTQKTCKSAVVVGKLGSLYNNAILVRFNDGCYEYVMYINGIEGECDGDPGWYCII